MLLLVFLSLLWVGVSRISAQGRFSSYSGEYGGSGGQHFDQSSNQLEGPVSALKIRANDRCILSIQVRYGDIWSNNEGSTSGSTSDLPLSFREGLVQVHGRFGNSVEYVAFHTNLGRVFAFGSSSGLGMSFTAQPLYPNTVLRFVSGRSGSLVNAIGFHWDEDQWIGGWNQSIYSTNPPPVTQI